jgi:hypothetical protein
MATIFGGSGRLLVPNEVILSGNEDLGLSGPGEFGRFGDDKNEGPPRPRVGDVLSIHLSQNADSAAVWILRVFVQVAQGEFVLGPDIVTNPPKPALGTGDPPARTVGFASCPGTIGWKVLALCDVPTEIAELVIQSRQGGGGSSSFGITPNSFIPPG